MVRAVYAGEKQTRLRQPGRAHLSRQLRHNSLTHDVKRAGDSHLMLLCGRSRLVRLGGCENECRKKLVAVHSAVETL